MEYGSWRQSQRVAIPRNLCVAVENRCDIHEGHSIYAPLDPHDQTAPCAVAGSAWLDLIIPIPSQ